MKHQFPNSGNKKLLLLLFLHNIHDMETLASNTLIALKSTAPIDQKLKHLTELKAEIKHRHCPEHAVGPLFDAIRISLATPHLTDAAFSILGHLMKRLELQDQDSLLHAQGVKTYPCLLERLTDQKDRTRHRALQAFTDFHSVSATDVEQFVRDHALTNRHPKVKEAGMQWVLSVCIDLPIVQQMLILPRSVQRRTSPSEPLCPTLWTVSKTLMEAFDGPPKLRSLNCSSE